MFWAKTTLHPPLRPPVTVFALHLLYDFDALVGPWADQQGVAPVFGTSTPHPRTTASRRSRTRPTLGHLHTSVIGLANEEVRVEDRPGGAPPRAIGRDALLSAVLVLDVQLREKLRASAIVGAPAVGDEPDEPGVPAVAQDSAQDVRASRE